MNRTEAGIITFPRSRKEGVVRTTTGIRFFDEDSMVNIRPGFVPSKIFESKYLVVPNVGRVCLRGTFAEDTLSSDQGIAYVNGQIMEGPAEDFEDYNGFYEIDLLFEELFTLDAQVELDIDGKMKLVSRIPLAEQGDTWGITERWQKVGRGVGRGYWFYCPPVSRDLSKLSFSFHY